MWALRRKKLRMDKVETPLPLYREALGWFINSFVEPRIRRVFLLLILAQAVHSAEEYFTKLYDVFPPARFASGLISNNLALGFLVDNAALVSFGLWCWAVPVRLGWRSARAFVWFWTILELSVGIIHCVLALLRGGYYPGIATAPLLILIAAWLAILQSRAGAAKSADPLQ